MALTISAQITGQVATNTTSYCYLYEPMRVVVSESDVTATKLYADIRLIDTENSATTIKTYTKFVEFDINTGNNITVDLMKVAQQIHDPNLYKFSNISDIVVDGYANVVSKYKYIFAFYTDKTALLLANEVHKLPILGGRNFLNFTPNVTVAQTLNEFGVYSNSFKAWNGWPYVSTSLSSPSAINSKPSVTIISPVSGEDVCGGYIIWKSRYSGWMQWGFDLKVFSENKRYEGNIETGMFESTQEIGGDPYVETDYIGISSSYSITLKSLSLSIQQLKAVGGIKTSPAIYYMKDEGGDLELMRLTSATAPNDSKINGGDFSVSLQSISKTSHKVR